jgi:hypothetical protein
MSILWLKDGDVAATLLRWSRRLRYKPVGAGRRVARCAYVGHSGRLTRVATRSSLKLWATFHSARVELGAIDVSTPLRSFIVPPMGMTASVCWDNGICLLGYDLRRVDESGRTRHVSYRTL